MQPGIEQIRPATGLIHLPYTCLLASHSYFLMSCGSTSCSLDDVQELILLACRTIAFFTLSQPASAQIAYKQHKGFSR